MKVHTCSFRIDTLSSVSFWEHYYQTKLNVENITVLHPLRATPYMDSKSFFTMISCHFGSIFKLLLLSEATSVFSAAREDILIMVVLSFCGSPIFYKLEIQM
jgi:hypothetical protein